MYVKFNAKITAKKRRGPREDTIVSKDRNKARAWLIEGARSDDEEEVHPGSGLTWRQVEVISGANEVVENRRSARYATTTIGSSSSRDSQLQGIIGEEEDIDTDEDVTDDDEEGVDMDSDDDSGDEEEDEEGDED